MNRQEVYYHKYERDIQFLWNMAESSNRSRKSKVRYDSVYV